MNKLTFLFLLSAVASPLYAGERFSVSSIQTLKMNGIERQTLDYSCGAAALSILLTHYFEDSLSEEDILADMIYRQSKDELIETAREGFSLLHLKQSAQRLGYNVEGVRLTLSQAKILRGPVIILLRGSGLNHFVVLKGITEGRAFISDPSRGHYRIPTFKLMEKWRGETLVLGRDNFGLPIEHGMSLPSSDFDAPERQTVRALRNIPIH